MLSESQVQEQSQNQNQNLLTLIDACKSVDPHDTDTGPRDEKTGEDAARDKDREREKERTRRDEQEAPHLLLAEHIYQRCVARGSQASTSSTDQRAEETVQEDVDAVALDSWKGARLHTQDSSVPLSSQEYMNSATSSFATTEEALAFLDMHLPHWAASTSTSEVESGLVDSVSSDAGIVGTGSLQSGEGGASTTLLQPNQQNLIISPALIEASTSTTLPTSVSCSHVASSSDCGASSRPGSVSSQIALFSADGKRTKKRCQADAAMDRCGAVKRTRTDKEVERCQGIIRRFHARGDVLPRHQKRITSNDKRKALSESVRSSPAGETEQRFKPELNTDLELEYQDAAKLKNWRQSLLRISGEDTDKAQKQKFCPAEVQELLDFHIPYWREPSLKKAHEIVERYKKRGGILPREWRDRKNCPVREQEYQDANKLKHWKQALRGVCGRSCSSEVCDFLDQNMPGWRSEERKRRKQMQLWLPEAKGCPLQNLTDTVSTSSDWRNAANILLEARNKHSYSRAMPSEVGLSDKVCLPTGQASESGQYFDDNIKQTQHDSPLKKQFEQTDRRDPSMPSLSTLAGACENEIALEESDRQVSGNKKCLRPTFDASIVESTSEV